MRAIEAVPRKDIILGHDLTSLEVEGQRYRQGIVTFFIANSF